MNPEAERRTFWLRRPRYSPIELAIFLLLATIAGAATAFFYVAKERQMLRQAALKSPLPAVVVAPSVPGAYADSNEYDFSKDWVSRYVPVWGIVLGPFKGRPGVHYLEIGAYEGRSVLWMLENILTDPSARVTAVDPFDGPYKDVYSRNINRSGFSDRVTTLTGFSQVILRQLPLDSFDIIYVDGSHEPDDTLEDAVLSWRLLRRGGLMIFDNYRLLGRLTYRNTDHYSYPKPAIDAFVQCVGRKCEVIHNERQLIIRKKAE